MMKKIALFLSFIGGVVFGAGILSVLTSKEVRKQRKYGEEKLNLYLMMNQWVRIKQQNRSLVEFFRQHGYKEIAVYGMNYVGKTLVNELKDTDIHIKYAIDKNADNIFVDDLKIMQLNTILPEVDAVIVTPISFYDEIEAELSNRMNCPIISIEDLVYELE